MEIKQETLEQLLEMAQDIRGYIQAENLDTEHKDLFFMAETLENKVAELVGDES